MDPAQAMGSDVNNGWKLELDLSDESPFLAWAFPILAHQLCLPEGAQAKFIFVHHKVSCVYDRFTPPSKFPPLVFGTGNQPREKQVFTSLQLFSLRRI
ncbi:unnamed protein product [Caretta caretta]